MSNEQSIRDELMQTILDAIDARQIIHNTILASPLIRRIQAEALRKFRADLIGSQFVRYGIVLPDINEVVDDLDEAADRIEN